MAKSPDYLPSDSTTAQGVIGSHLLPIQMALIDQIARATLEELVFDQVLHSIALQLQNALQTNCCLIVQSGRDSNNSSTQREAREGLMVGPDKMHLCQGDIFLSTSFAAPTSLTLLNNCEPLVTIATTQQENRLVQSDQDSRLYRICRGFYDYYDSWLAQGKLVIMPASEQYIPQEVRDWATESGISQFLMVPLFNLSSYLGGIALYRHEHHQEWTQQEISFVQAIAEQCAIALTVTALQQRYQAEFKKRQESERVLQESQRRLRAICSQTCELLGLLTPDGSILEVNQTVLECAGVQAKDLVGQRLWQAPWWIPSVKTHNQLQTAIAAAALGECVRYDVEILGASQQIVNLDLSLKPIRDEAGKVEFLIFEGRDITDYKQTQSELQATLARNHALLEAIPDLIFRVTRDGIYIDWKAAKENTLPLRTHKILGKHLHQVLPTELAGLLWNHVELALETNEIQLLEYQLWVNGKSHNLEIRLVKSGTDEAVVTVQDVTERVQTRVALEQVNDILESRVEQRTAALKEANRTLREEIIERKRIEGALRVSEERFRQAVVNAPFPIMIHSEDGEVLKINQIWTELTGYTHDEIPTISDWTQRALGEQQEKMRSLITQLYNLNDRVDQGEFTVTTKHTENRIWSFSSAPLGQLPDSRRLIITMATDITERKRAEEEIRKALAQEKELTELKSRFITLTSHEFRTPLTTIQSSAELLEHYSPRWSEEKKLTHLHRIQLSVKHMTRLLNDVLIIGKADAGKLMLNPVPLDLEKFCSNLVEELQLNDMNQHVITFSYDAQNLVAENSGQTRELTVAHRGALSPSSSPIRLMDGKLLWQILDNLLSNAMKYSPEGSTVKLTLRCFCNRAIFIVCDRGIGIPKEDQSRLFETFHRATNVGAIAGTGLGLAIVKKCVDIHQGQIVVESEVGVGSTFSVTLPIYNSPLTYDKNFSD